MTTPSDGVYLRQMELGPMQNFVYLIGDPETRDCVAVDPAWEIDAILGQVRADGMHLTGVLVTHTHQDHVGGHLFGHDIPGIEDLLAKASAKVYVHAAEREFLRGFGSDLVKVGGGDTLDVGRMKITFVHTPGHTPGSQCFLVEDTSGPGHLVSGDTLFLGSCGRVDLPGSDPEAMYRSLSGTLKQLPDETLLFPGHLYAADASSTMGEQKRRNPFLRVTTLEQFLGFVGA